jgi:hypothetical protein
MKAIWTSCLALLLTGLVACGGSSSSSPPPPPPNNAGYSNASLSGNYVFRLSGIDLNGGAFVAVGVFTADGNGNITSGQEDANDFFSGPLQVGISSGTYSVGSDGRGQATLNFANSAPSANFNFVLLSTAKARIVELSNFELSSGVLEQQSAAPLTTPTGSYVLRMDGTNNTQLEQPISRVGLFTATGAGSASVVLDENYNGFFTPTIAVSAITVSNFSGTTGRGVLQFNTTTGGASSTGTFIDLVFYVVNSTRIEFLSVNPSEQLSGHADLQSGTFTTASVSSPYVFSIGGFPAIGFITESGSFTLNSGAVNSGLEDFVNNGAYSASAAFSGTYAADSANNGHFTGSYTGSGRTVNFVLWFSSAQSAMMMAYNSTNSLLETGEVTMQPAVPTAGTISGNYALHLGGYTAGGVVPTVLEGQLLADGVGTFTGLEDFNQGFNVTIGASANGNYSVVSGRGTGTIGGVPVVLYPAGSSTIYVMSTDGSRMLTGSLEAQH